MPRYSAPGAIRRCHIPPLQFTEPVPTYRRRNIADPPPPAGNRRAPSCASRVSPRSCQDGDRPLRRARTGRRPASMLPPRELASSWDGPRRRARATNRGDSGRGTFTRPIPEHAAVLGQRADRSSGPAAATPSGRRTRRATCRRRHLSAGTSPRRSPRSARCGPVTPTGRDLRHIAGSTRLPSPWIGHAPWPSHGLRPPLRQDRLDPGSRPRGFR